MKYRVFFKISPEGEFRRVHSTTHDYIRCTSTTEEWGALTKQYDRRPDGNDLWIAVEAEDDL